MWAQIMMMRLRPGRGDELPMLFEQVRAIEQADSGLLRTTAMRDQNDPERIVFLNVFESEERARERERDPRREEGMQGIRATMADIFDGPPEFIDLTVITERSA